MKKIIIGGLAVLVGVTGVSLFFSSFLSIIFGSLPILLILGGALAFYLGFADVQEGKKEQAPNRVLEPKSQPKQTIEEPSIQEPMPEPTRETAPQSLPPLFKGNAETLVFHSIECKFSQGKKCTEQFTTREDAIKNGYKPCKICKP